MCVMRMDYKNLCEIANLFEVHVGAYGVCMPVASSFAVCHIGKSFGFVIQRVKFIAKAT